MMRFVEEEIGVGEQTTLLDAFAAKLRGLA
jgi:hypothetical protein